MHGTNKLKYTMCVTGQALPAHTICLSFFCYPASGIFSVTRLKCLHFIVFEHQYTALYSRNVVNMKSACSTHVAHFGHSGIDAIKTVTCLFIAIKNWYTPCVLLMSYQINLTEVLCLHELK